MKTKNEIYEAAYAAYIAAAEKAHQAAAAEAEAEETMKTRNEVYILKNGELASIEQADRAAATMRLLNEWEAERGSGVKWTLGEEVKK